MLTGNLTDFVGNGAHLSITGPGGDDKVVGRGREAPQIQNDNVTAVPLVCHFGRGQGERSCLCFSFLGQILSLFGSNKKWGGRSDHPDKLQILDTDVNKFDIISLAKRLRSLTAGQHTVKCCIANKIGYALKAET